MTTSLVKWLRISVKYLIPFLSDAFYAVQLRKRSKDRHRRGQTNSKDSVRQAQIQIHTTDKQERWQAWRKQRIPIWVHSWLNDTRRKEELWFLTLVQHQSMHYWWLCVYCHCVQTDEIPLPHRDTLLRWACSSPRSCAGCWFLFIWHRIPDLCYLCLSFYINCCSQSGVWSPASTKNRPYVFHICFRRSPVIKTEQEVFI